MKTIELNEQAQDWLIEHLNGELELEYSETSKGIMRHILSKLEKEKELPPVSLDEMLTDKI